MSIPIKQERLAKFAEVDLYPVTCEQLSAGRSDLEVLDGIIAGGARIVQLRDKESSKRDYYHKAVEFRKRTAEAGILLIVNDYVDVAIAVDADGVHLGQDDLPLAVARELMPDKIIGVSSHDHEEAVEAVAGGADYYNIGPIYMTGTKEGVTSCLGPEAIQQISSGIDVPFTCMGGIKLDNIDPVLAAGARIAAVVTAITMADDIAAAVVELRERIIEGRNG